MVDPQVSMVVSILLVLSVSHGLMTWMIWGYLHDFGNLQLVFFLWLKNTMGDHIPKHHPTFLASAMSTQSDTNQPSRWSLNVSGMFDLYFMPTATVGGHCMLSMKKDNRLDSSVDSCNLTHVKSFVDLTAPFTLVESG